MSIPNPTPEQVASQNRLRARAAAKLEQRGIPFSRVDQLLVDRPELADVAAAGVVLREQVRWSA